MSGYVPYSDVYTAPQNNRSGPIRPDRQGVRYDPTEDYEETARRQQMEAWNMPGARRAPLSNRNLDQHRRRTTRERSADDTYGRRDRRRRHDDYDSDYETFSDYEESNRQGRQSQGDQDGRRTQSEQREPQKEKYNGDVKGFVGQNFDVSPDGALYAALGAGVGAMAARRFLGNHFDPKTGDNHWKTAGGAVIGGLAANAAEKQWQKRKRDKMRESEAFEN